MLEPGRSQKDFEERGSGLGFPGWTSALANRLVDILCVSDCGIKISLLKGFPGGSDGKKSACNAGDLALILWSGRSPGEGTVNPLQNSCLGSPRDRGAWQTTVHGVARSLTGLSDLHLLCGALSIPKVYGTKRARVPWATWTLRC